MSAVLGELLGVSVCEPERLVEHKRFLQEQGLDFPRSFEPGLPGWTLDWL
jgi:hypothetical protein